MMNTLANHGYLPHDGRNLTQDAVVSALKNGINFDEGLGTLMFQMAVPVNPEPNATFFTLDQLNQHNVLEHDASLSRSDAFFGNNHVFNETVFETSIKYWSGEILDANQLAMSKVFRQVESKAFNPEYTFSTTTEAFSLGELAAPIIVFGDHASSTVNRTLVEYFFRTSKPPCARAFCCPPPPETVFSLLTFSFFKPAGNEKLPSELGWTPQAEAVTQETAMAQSKVIEDAVSLFTSSNATASSAARRRAVIRDLHAGFLS